MTVISESSLLFFSEAVKPVPEPEPEPTGCVVNGKTYKEGETYKIECNRCRCLNGDSACTKMGCRGCTHDGIYYNRGDSFMLGLNTTCTCFGHDNIGCQSMPNPTPNHCYYNGSMYRTEEEFTDDCNLCICAGNNLVKCTVLDCASPKLGCYWGEKKYENGQIVFDQCNECVCTIDMFFFCTKCSCI